MFPSIRKAIFNPVGAMLPSHNPSKTHKIHPTTHSKHSPPKTHHPSTRPTRSQPSPRLSTRHLRTPHPNPTAIHKICRPHSNQHLQQPNPSKTHRIHPTTHPKHSPAQNPPTRPHPPPRLSTRHLRTPHPNPTAIHKFSKISRFNISPKSVAEALQVTEREKTTSLSILLL